MMRVRGWLLVLAGAALLGACAGEIPTGSDLDELRSAPTQVSVDGKALVLGAELWRDFMPVSPPDGQPLVAVLQLRTQDGSPAPAGVALRQVYVVFSDQLWAAEPRREDPGSDRWVARNGPKWAPGARVDVVVRLEGADGKAYLLRAPDVTIGRTE